MRGIRVITSKLRNVLNDPLLLGQVIKTANNNQLKTVKVLKMQLNNSLKMYFNKSIEINCTDTTNVSKNGDVVLIKRIEPLVKPFESYEVKEVIFKAGLTVDPVTNEKINKTALEAI